MQRTNEPIYGAGQVQIKLGRSTHVGLMCQVRFLQTKFDQPKQDKLQLPIWTGPKLFSTPISIPPAVKFRRISQNLVPIENNSLPVYGVSEMSTQFHALFINHAFHQTSILCCYQLPMG